MLTVWQGGRLNAEEVKEAQLDPLLKQKLSVRRWDDQAKVPEAKVPGLEAYEEMAVQSLRISRVEEVAQNGT
jgi:predicted HD phosphohydrolase